MRSAALDIDPPPLRKRELHRAIPPAIAPSPKALDVAGHRERFGIAMANEGTASSDRVVLQSHERGVPTEVTVIDDVDAIAWLDARPRSAEGEVPHEPGPRRA